MRRAITGLVVCLSGVLSAFATINFAAQVKYTVGQSPMGIGVGDLTRQNPLLSPTILNSNLEALFKNKVAMLRMPSSTSVLRFEADGSPENTQEPGAWTLYGRIQIEHIALSHDSTLVLAGKRVFVSFDDLKQQKLLRSDEKVRVEIAFRTAPQMPEILMAMKKVFLSSNEPFSSIVPTYWKAFFDKNGSSPGKPSTTTDAFTAIANDVPRVGGNIKAPTPIFTPDPKYNEIASTHGVQGRTVLWCVVDEGGRARDIQIVKPLGLGLDERAVEAVAKWKFRPATQNGTPVAVQINVEVNFRMFP